MPQPTPARVILLRAQAPAQPALGAPCNGCGLCCAAEPCPLGMLLSRRRRGRCRALLWSHDERRYLCGALAQPGRWFRGWPATWVRLAVRRWIAASQGCDASLAGVRSADLG